MATGRLEVWDPKSLPGVGRALARRENRSVGRKNADYSLQRVTGTTEEQDSIHPPKVLRCLRPFGNYLIVPTFKL